MERSNHTEVPYCVLWYMPLRTSFVAGSVELPMLLKVPAGVQPIT